MRRKEIKKVVDYIARNHRCTFPTAWDTGEGVEAEVTFARPSEAHAQAATARRDALVEEIKAALRSTR